MKNCIFNQKKICNNCGECEVCDLDSNKKCNNCGKCLEKQGVDTKAIKINEIQQEEKFVNKDDLKKVLDQDEEELKAAEEFEKELADVIYDDYDDDFKKVGEFAIENNDSIDIDYIEDIDGLNELLDDMDRDSDLIYEEFPGLIKVKHTNK